MIAAIFIISIVAGLAIVSNYLKETSNIKFDHLGKELEIESANVLDYGIKNNENIKELLINFTKDYSKYSIAESLYFIFGNQNQITVAGYKKIDSGSIFVDVGSGNEELSLNKGEYGSRDFGPAENIEITIDGIIYDFTLKSGENFYFIISKEIDGEKYIFTK